MYGTRARDKVMGDNTLMKDNWFLKLKPDSYSVSPLIDFSIEMLRTKSKCFSLTWLHLLTLVSAKRTLPPDLYSAIPGSYKYASDKIIS